MLFVNALLSEGNKGNSNNNYLKRSVSDYMFTCSLLITCFLLLFLGDLLKWRMKEYLEI